MIDTSLFEKALLEPIRSHAADELLVITGYSNALMARRHLDYVSEILNVEINLRLIIGMTGEEGIGENIHKGLVDLEEERPDKFSCSYVTPPNGVHSKLYIWRKDGTPVESWMGSANYTQRGFGLLGSSSRRFEILTQDNPLQAQDYFNHIDSFSMFINHGEIEDIVRLTKPRRSVHDEISLDIKDDYPVDYSSLNSIELNLYTKSGEVPERSGLNWGQREGRDKNQAYISIPVDKARDTDFFPPVGTYFTIKTDDGKQLIFTRAQANGKALQTPQSNALWGEYVRNRIGASNGQKITRAMLKEYGADTITIYKIDDEQYFLDFSPNT